MNWRGNGNGRRGVLLKSENRLAHLGESTIPNSGDRPDCLNLQPAVVCYHGKRERFG